MALLNDKRFSWIPTDVRFRPVPKKEKKVKIDDRFKAMFDDERFNLKYTVDKRGRPCNTTTSESLRKFYDLSSESDDDDEFITLKKKPINKHKNKPKVFKSEKQTAKTKSENKIKRDVEVSDDSNEENELVKSKKKNKMNRISVNNSVKKNKVNKLNCEESGISTSDSGNESDEAEEFDFARGEGSIDSSSSSDSSDLEYDDSLDIEHPWGEIHVTAPEATESTRRLAVCHMDWDRVKAMDLFILLNSFKPTEGIIYKVSVYPSDFGLQRLKEEELCGPLELRNSKEHNANDISVEEEKDDISNELIRNKEDDSDSISSESFDEEENKFENKDDDELKEKLYKAQIEKLRQYQLNRLKYFYAIVECDSPETASAIYTECDGKEFEGSGVKIDLRFVPDVMEFDQTPISEVSNVNDTTIYKPLPFVTTALQQSRVNCTWEEMNFERRSITMRKFGEKELEESDLRTYLASSSDEEESWPVASIFDHEESETSEFPKLSEINDGDPAKKYQALLKNLEENEASKHEKNMELEITWEPGLKETADELLKKKEKESMTPWEEYLQKKKDKKKAKKLSKKQVEILPKTFSDDEIPSDVDLNDTYFKDSFGPEFTESIKKPKKQKKKTNIENQKETEEDKKKKAELELLIMEDDEQQHFNLDQLVENNKLKTKRKRKLMKKSDEKTVEDNFKVNVNDRRFEALYTSPNFHIDPSNAQFKKTKGMEAFVQEKIRRIGVIDSETIQIKTSPELYNKENNSTFTDPQLSLLIKSVKSATHSFKKYKH